MNMETLKKHSSSKAKAEKYFCVEAQVNSSCHSKSLGTATVLILHPSVFCIEMSQSLLVPTAPAD